MKTTVQWTDPPHRKLQHVKEQVPLREFFPLQGSSGVSEMRVVPGHRDEPPGLDARMGPPGGHVCIP